MEKDFKKLVEYFKLGRCRFFIAIPLLSSRLITGCLPQRMFFVYRWGFSSFRPFSAEDVLISFLTTKQFSLTLFRHI